MLYPQKTFRKIRLIFVLSLMVSSVICRAQNQGNVLTNADVISLFKGGVSKSTILTKIQSSSTNFDTSVNAILSLKKEGLPDDLIDAIVNKQSPNSPQTNPQTNTAGNNQTSNNLTPGIYYEDNAGAKTQLEENVFSQAKSGSIMLSAVTYGIAKTKSKAFLSGEQANFQIRSSNPVFYFVFPANNDNSTIGNEQSTGGWFTNATNPNEFLLIKFKVSKKGREVVTGSFGTYSGFSSGIDDDNKVSYRFAKLSPGYYKVYFETPLKEGEYAFIFAGAPSVDGADMGASTTLQKAFDFSVVK